MYLIFTLCFTKKSPALNQLIQLKSFIKCAKSKDIKHFKTLDPDNLPAELLRLFKNHIFIMPIKMRLMFELHFCLLLRPGEFCSILRDHIFINPNGNSYLIVENTKTLKSFKVPLTDYAVSLIQMQLEATKNTDSPYLFPSGHPHYKDSHVSTSYFRQILRMRGCDFFTPHGARSAGANFYGDSADKIPYQVGEACLQHRYASTVQMAYDRTFLYKPRIGAMQIWNDFVQETIGNYSVLKQL